MIQKWCIAFWISRCGCLYCIEKSHPTIMHDISVWVGGCRECCDNEKTRITSMIKVYCHHVIKAYENIWTVGQKETLQWCHAFRRDWDPFCCPSFADSWQGWDSDSGQQMRGMCVSHRGWGLTLTVSTWQTKMEKVPKTLTGAKALWQKTTQAKIAYVN